MCAVLVAASATQGRRALRRGWVRGSERDFSCGHLLTCPPIFSLCTFFSSRVLCSHQLQTSPVGLGDRGLGAGARAPHAPHAAARSSTRSTPSSLARVRAVVRTRTQRCRGFSLIGPVHHPPHPRQGDDGVLSPDSDFSIRRPLPQHLRITFRVVRNSNPEVRNARLPL